MLGRCFMWMGLFMRGNGRRKRRRVRGRRFSQTETPMRGILNLIYAMGKENISGVMETYSQGIFTKIEDMALAYILSIYIIYIYIYIKYRANGSKYEGYWLNNRKNVRGKESTPDGNVYEGEYNNGRRHGNGKFTWANGDTYNGNFDHDYMHGFGIFEAYIYIYIYSYLYIYIYIVRTDTDTKATGVKINTVERAG